MSESWDIKQAKEYLAKDGHTFSVRHFLGGAIKEVELLGGKYKEAEEHLLVYTQGQDRRILREIESLTKERDELKKQLVICDEVDDEDQVIFNHYEKLVVEVESLTEAKDDNFKEVMALQSANEKLEADITNYKQVEKHYLSLITMPLSGQEEQIKSLTKERNECEKDIKSLTRERDDFQCNAEGSSQIIMELEAELAASEKALKEAEDQIRNPEDYPCQE